MAMTFISCQQKKQLPILGKKEIINGREVTHQIPEFHFVNQDSQAVTPESFHNKVYVANFFFTSCPTQCPKMNQQMLRIHEHFKANSDLYLLSHSIDTKYDTVGRLREYAQQLGVSAPKWQFVTGKKSEIFAIANDYFNVVVDDDTAPGGFDHTSRLILIDKQKQIRSYCNGINAEEVNEFIKDIEILLDEK